MVKIGVHLSKLSQN